MDVRMKSCGTAGQVGSAEYNRGSLPDQIKEIPAMRRAFTVSCLFAAIVMVGVACAHRHAGPEATEENFGVNMARMNLWREAMFRFQRAVEINPGDAMAHNNLAVAYEANGEPDKALKEYREAMRLDKSNQYIQKNYSRFVEFTSRNKKRQQRNAPKAATTTKAPAATTTAPAPAPPPPPAPAPPVIVTTTEPPVAVTTTDPPATTSTAPPPQPAPQPKPPGDEP
jgi:tetratricopeptide (TPR) repeat protein